MAAYFEWPFIYPELRATPPDWEEEFIRAAGVVTNNCDGKTILVDRRANLIQLNGYLVDEVNHEDHITKAMVELLFELGVKSHTLLRLQYKNPMVFLQQCDQACNEIERMMGERRIHLLQTGFFGSFPYTANEALLQAKSYTSQFRATARRYQMAIELVKRGLPLTVYNPRRSHRQLQYFAKGSGIWRGCIEDTIDRPEDMLPVLASFDALRAYFPDDVARMMAVYMYPAHLVIGCHARIRLDWTTLDSGDQSTKDHC
jgi:hypothetical protein